MTVRVVMLVGRSTGGIGTHAVDLTRHLGDLGVEVSFVTDALTAERFSLADARRWWPSRDVGVRGTVRNLLRLRRLLARSDVVHAHGHQAGMVATLALLGLGRPRLVVSQHNAVLATAAAARWGALAGRVVARRAALVTGASSDLVEDARRSGARHAALAEVPSPRVPGLLAQPTLDRDERRAEATRLLAEHGVEPTGPLVLDISRIAPQKNLRTVVQAAGEATRAGVAATWVVLGDGDLPLLDRLLEMVQDTAAPVHFLGRIGDPEPWLRAAEVFVLPSQWEARALVVQEAMAAGAPVVASDAGGLTDLVGGVGDLVPVGDAEALAAAVGALLGDPVRRDAVSLGGRERASRWEDPVSSARRWRDVYEGLAGMKYSRNPW